MKRVFDIALAAVALVLLSPVLAVIAWKVRRTMGSPILFRQTRPGRNGEPFLMVKFRTMRDEYDVDGGLLSDEARLTPFGLFLRSTSLDELPELWNVLKGDMSIVGPRPLLMEYLPLYNAKQARRHEVRPGITGWAQINGRNAIGWEDKFALDIWYIDNWSFWLDVRVIALTIKKVLVREGINSSDSVTMLPFAGSRSEKEND